MHDAEFEALARLGEVLAFGGADEYAEIAGSFGLCCCSRFFRLTVACLGLVSPLISCVLVL